jgi:two-component system, LytTR family, sensor kinase
MMLEDGLLSDTSCRLSASPRHQAVIVNSELWRIIFTAGGLSWAFVTAIGVLWFWPVSGTVQGGDYIAGSATRLLLHLLLFLVSAAAYRIAIGLDWPARPMPQLVVVVANIILALIVVRLSPFVLVVSSYLLESAQSFSDHAKPWLALRITATEWLTLLRIWLPAYFIGLIAVALVITSRRSHRRTVQLAEMSVELANSRMATLSAQLHPHFLFNSLNTISGLIPDDPDQAVQMVGLLGDFLRIALESSKKPWTVVRDEVTGVEAYLAVQQSRFGDRLKVNLTVESDSTTVPMPALLLQPLVENAIQHGLSGNVESLEVAVTVSRHGDRLKIVVANSAPQISQRLLPISFGDGLRNVSARLFAAYGDAGTMTIGADPVRGTRAELSMPATVTSIGGSKITD